MVSSTLSIFECLSIFIYILPAKLDSEILNSFDDLSEPIQSRCAVLRYSKLSDAQVLKRLLEVCESEKVSYTDDGLEAIVFTAQGDMRQVLFETSII